MALFKALLSMLRTGKDSSGSRERHDFSEDSTSGPETRPVKMTLEERMAFRKELLHEIIRASLSSRFIPSNTYRFKVMRCDERGHAFVVMLDVSPTFLASPAGDDASLNETAAVLIKNAKTKYGLQVSGVYWRSNEKLDVSVADSVKTTIPASVALSAVSGRKGSMDKSDALTADEMAAFEAAWQTDSDILIGERTYATEFAPLSDGDEESRF